jgi:hypothetical protein
MSVRSAPWRPETASSVAAVRLALLNAESLTCPGKAGRAAAGAAALRPARRLPGEIACGVRTHEAERREPFADAVPRLLVLADHVELRWLKHAPLGSLYRHVGTRDDHRVYVAGGLVEVGASMHDVFAELLPEPADGERFELTLAGVVAEHGRFVGASNYS